MEIFYRKINLTKESTPSDPKFGEGVIMFIRYGVVRMLATCKIQAIKVYDFEVQKNSLTLEMIKFLKFSKLF